MRLAFGKETRPPIKLAIGYPPFAKTRPFGGAFLLGEKFWKILDPGTALRMMSEIHPSHLQDFSCD